MILVIAEQKDGKLNRASVETIAAAQQILSLALPTKSKQTQMIGGSAGEAAKELVRRLREEARVL